MSNDKIKEVEINIQEKATAKWIRSFQCHRPDLPSLLSSGRACPKGRSPKSIIKDNCLISGLRTQKNGKV